LKRALIHLGWLIGLAQATAWGGPSSKAIELKDGDRVVLIGSTLIEREQESSYLETWLTVRSPGRGIVFRNLGWSGDTVEGVSRGESLGPGAGFRQLVDHVVALKPTVIVLGYGANESFGGQAGLPAFRLGLGRLWDELARTGARFVVLTPNRQENLPPPLPDPTAHNADLESYGSALRDEAERRRATCIDLFTFLLDGASTQPPQPWTSNGLHLSPSGYWKAAGLIVAEMAQPPGMPWQVDIDGGAFAAAGTRLTELQIEPTGARFRLLDDLLPDPVCPDPRIKSSNRRLRVDGLAAGRYQLNSDGKKVVTADAGTWAEGVTISEGPEFAQVEALRSRINAKNLMYFHRWRPQNETYLFGFRKHEQGKNAAELAAFDPLIAAAEGEIARLSRPVPHAYELVRLREEEVPR